MPTPKITAEEYRRLSWREVAISCKAAHDGKAGPDFWFLSGLLGMKIQQQGAEETADKLFDAGFQHRDKDILAMLGQIIETGKLRGV